MSASGPNGDRTPGPWLALAALVITCCGEEPPDREDISRDYCAIVMSCTRPNVAITYDDEAECEAHRAELYQKATEEKNAVCRRAQTTYEACVAGLDWCAGFEEYSWGRACAAETDTWFYECFGVRP